MEVKNCGMCRGRGKGYVKVKLVDAPSEGTVLVEAKTDDRSTPALWVPEYEAEEGNDVLLGVLVFPLFKAANTCFEIKVVGRDGTLLAIQTLSVSMRRLKWKSRFNYRFHKDLCTKLCAAEVNNKMAHIRVEQLLCMPDGGETVWRLCAEAPFSVGEAPKIAFRCFDAAGNYFPYTPIFFEDQEIAGKQDLSSMRRLTVAFRLPSSMRRFALEVYDETGVLAPGIFGVAAGEYDAAISSTRAVIKDASNQDDYRTWCEAHRVSADELAAQRQYSFFYQPLISIIVPCFKPNQTYLRAMLESVLAQSYTSWELILVDSIPETSGVEQIVERTHDARIKRIPTADNLGIVGNTNLGINQAVGEYVAFLDYDDTLAPNALFEYVAAINENPEAGAFYCDEDTFEQEGVYQSPVFKSDFNQDLLYCHNFVTHLLMVHKPLLDEVGLSVEEVNGAQDYDLVLRVLETGRSIIHVPHILYHWRMHADSTSGDNAKSKPYAHTAGKLALQRHFERRKIDVCVEDGKISYTYRVRYVLPAKRPQVDILIPSKDHIDMLDRCISSILNTCTYDNYQITVLENNSTEQETFAYYKELQKRDLRVKVITWKEEFNYSRIINFGVDNTQGEYVLLLNNDTEAISPDFIEEMLGYLQRSEVGVVGAKLYFHDRLVQHAGMVIGPYDTVVHVNQNLPSDHGGYLSRAERPGNFSSVTGACQMVKRSIFSAVGGYSESFAVGYNDADFCCKVVESGHLVVFTPYAELFHYEFVSRGREEGDTAKTKRWEQERALMLKTWPQYFEKGDPFSNPNLKRDSTYFALY